MERGDTVQYIGDNHPVLVKGEEYRIYSMIDGGLRVITDTGYVGLTIGQVILAKI